MGDGLACLGAEEVKMVLVEGERNVIAGRDRLLGIEPGGDRILASRLQIDVELSSHVLDHFDRGLHIGPVGIAIGRVNVLGTDSSTTRLVLAAVTIWLMRCGSATDMPGA